MLLALSACPRAGAAEHQNISPDAYAAFCMGVARMNAGDFPGAAAWFEQTVKFDPSAVQAHELAGAVFAEQLRMPAEAQKHFERALALNPQSFVARIGLGKQLLRSGKIDEGTKEIRQALDSPQAKANAALLSAACAELAAAAEAQGKLSEAEGYYKRAITAAPGSVALLVRMALVQRKMGNNEQAAEALQTVKHLVPTYAPILRDLCNTYEAMGRWSEALAELDAYMSHRSGPGETPQLLQEASMLAERSGQPQAARAFREKRLAKLLAAYQPEKADPQLCIDLAGALEELGRLPEAEPYLRKALESAPDKSKLELRMRLAQLYERSGSTDKAAEELKALTQAVEPRESVPFRTELSRILEQAGKLPEAEALLAEITAIPGAKAAGHAELGLFYSRRGQLDKAAAELRKAIELADSQHSLAYRIDLGQMYADAGRADDAERVLVDAQKMYPSDAAANNALGWFYAKRGLHLTEAQAMIETALKQQPANAAFLDSLGWVFFKQGRTQDALKPLKKAAALTQDSVIWDHLGDVYLKLGQPEQAADSWQRALQLDPKTKGAREKLDKLNQERKP